MMKKKKIISLLCAAIMTMSALSGMVTSASAEEGIPAAIENTVTFDFETDETSALITEIRGMTSTIADDSTGNGTKVLSVTGSSSSSGEGRFGLATIDLSPYTDGKSHVIIDYDAYITNSGRMAYVLTDAVPETYGDGGLFKQGRTSGSDATNAITDAWIHTTVDVDLSTGTGTYTVMNGEETVVSGTIETEKHGVTVLAFISWSPNTSYIDNIKIQTGGELSIVTPDPTPVVTVAPEDASVVEGSNLDLKAADSTATLDDDWSDVSGSTAQVLNHSNAMIAQTTENTAITAYGSDVNVRGKSVYAAYDVYLTPDSQIDITPYGNSGASQASTLRLTADGAGVVTVSAKTSSGTPTAEERLVHGTWYRVLVEVPQNGDAESTSTGAITFTIYRINPEDPSQVLGIAARLTGLSSRGIANRSLSSFGLSVTGEVYIDNAVVYVASQREITVEYGDLATTYIDGTITVTDNTMGNIVKTAVAVVAVKENDVLTSVGVYPLTFSNGVATVSASVNEGDKVFIWDSMENLKPLAEVYIGQSSSEATE